MIKIQFQYNYIVNIFNHNESSFLLPMNTKMKDKSAMAYTVYFCFINFSHVIYVGYIQFIFKNCKNVNDTIFKCLLGMKKSVVVIILLFRTHSKQSRTRAWGIGAGSQYTSQVPEHV